MATRFRNELTIVPPVRVSVRNRELETMVDWGAGGVDRSLLSPGLRTIGNSRRAGPLPIDRYLVPGTRIDFGGGSVAAMTSSGLGSLKELLLATQAREREIKTDIRKARLQHVASSITRALAWSTLVPVVSRSVREKVNHGVAVRKGEIATLRGNLTSSRVSISFDMETAIAEPHRRMLDAFGKLAASHGSWALHTSQRIDRVRARSMSNVVVARRTARLARGADPLVDTADWPPSFPVQQGRSTAYFYPGFMLVIDAARTDFALIDLKELSVQHHATHFTEDGAVPSDGQLIGKVWAKSNKDGSRDRRFRDNRELPVLLYGELCLKATGGLHESFHFSRNDACDAFAHALNDLKRLLTRDATPTVTRPIKRLGH